MYRLVSFTSVGSKATCCAPATAATTLPLPNCTTSNLLRGAKLSAGLFGSKRDQPLVWRPLSTHPSLRHDHTPGNDQIGVAMIGAGDISNLHAAAISKLPAARLQGLWSRPHCPIVPDPSAKAAEYGCHLYDSAEQLCQDKEVDAVLILTNHETHLHYATMAMRAGKHVLVEKPVATSVGELEKMRNVAQEAGVVCMPSHNYVYEPHLQRTRGMIDAGSLGTVHAVYIMYNIHHPEDVCARLPGIIRQIGTHHAYVARYLLGGNPTSVSAFRATMRDEDKGTAPQENLAAITFQMDTGALAHLQLNFASDDHSSDAWSFYVKVIGSKGSTRYSYNDWVVNAKTMVHSHTYEPCTSRCCRHVAAATPARSPVPRLALGLWRTLPLGSIRPCRPANPTRLCADPHTIFAADKHFVEQVIPGKAPPLSGLEEAMFAQTLLDAAEQSCETGMHVRL